MIDLQQFFAMAMRSPIPPGSLKDGDNVYYMTATNWGK